MLRPFVTCLIVLLTIASGVQAAPRHVQELDGPWQFIRAEASTDQSAPPLVMAWQNVILPHTYNALDGADGGGYYRGAAWYKTQVQFDARIPSERTFIEFDGAAVIADIWINGTHVGKHEGAYARFRFDITDELRPGQNEIAVRTSNAKIDSVAPLGGDFTVFGGLFRKVRLVSVAEAHFDMMDFGGPGVYLTPSKVTSKSTMLAAVARVTNASKEAKSLTVRLSLIDATGAVVETFNSALNVAADAEGTATLSGVISRPHLWNGVTDPYLYLVRAELVSNGVVVDKLDQPLGFRDIRIDPNKGLYLNGQHVAIHGVNLFHSGRPEKGLAVSEADIDQDLTIMRDMGANGLRFVHFQHPPHAYDKADQDGFLVWTEIPMNGVISSTPAFQANITQQFKELVRQNYNHPSVIMWGIGNEVYKSDDDSNRLMDVLQKIAGEEDATRPTVYAHCCSAPNAPHAMHTNVIGYNIYNGWYPEQKGSLGDWVKSAHDLVPIRSIAISEYGAGASILQQEDPPVKPTPASYWHPEQYQALFHETAWRDLRDKPYLWGTFVWVGFDLASDGRKEGDRDGINDKGLVTYDRQTRKDAYFWYQANWTKDPMVYITSRRLIDRKAGATSIKVYANTKRASLILNGTAVATVPVNDHIAEWADVTLSAGSNTVQVVGETQSGARATDQVVWQVQ
jgi:beta-galactosidase